MSNTYFLKDEYNKGRVQVLDAIKTGNNSFQGEEVIVRAVFNIYPRQGTTSTQLFNSMMEYFSLNKMQP